MHATEIAPRGQVVIRGTPAAKQCVHLRGRGIDEGKVDQRRRDIGEIVRNLVGKRGAAANALARTAAARTAVTRG